MMKNFLAALKKSDSSDCDPNDDEISPLEMLKRAKQSKKHTGTETATETATEKQSDTVISEEKQMLDALVKSGIFQRVALSPDPDGAPQIIERLLNTDFSIAHEKKKLFFQGIPQAILEQAELFWKEKNYKDEKIQKTLAFLTPYTTGVYERKYQRLLKEGFTDQPSTLSAPEVATLDETLKDLKGCHDVIDSALASLNNTRNTIKTELNESLDFSYESTAITYCTARETLCESNLPYDDFIEIAKPSINVHYRSAYDYQLPKSAMKLAKAFNKILADHADDVPNMLPKVRELTHNPLFWKKAEGTSFYVQNNPFISANIYGREDAVASQAVYDNMLAIIACCWNIDQSTALTLGQLKDYLPSFLNRMFSNTKQKEETDAIAHNFISFYITRFNEKLANDSKEETSFITQKNQEIANITNEISSIQLPLLITSKRKLIAEWEAEITEANQRKETNDQKISFIREENITEIDKLNISYLLDPKHNTPQDVLEDLSKSLLRIIYTIEIDRFSNEILSGDVIQRIIFLTEQTKTIKQLLGDATREVEDFYKELRQHSCDAHQHKLNLTGDTYELPKDIRDIFNEYSERALAIPQLHSNRFKSQAAAIDRCIAVSLNTLTIINSEGKEKIRTLSRQLSSSENKAKQAEEEKNQAYTMAQELQNAMKDMVPSKETVKLIEVCQLMLVHLAQNINKNKENTKKISQLTQILNSPELLEQRLRELRPEGSFVKKLENERENSPGNRGQSSTNSLS